MKPTIITPPVGDDPPKASLYYGQNVVQTLSELPAGLVQVMCTSPPYWGLRDYGVDPQHWPEIEYRPMSGVPMVKIEAMDVAFGLEDDPAAYVGHMVAIFRELHRVMRDDGVVFLNIGDSYAGGGRNVGNAIENTSELQRSHLHSAAAGPGIIPEGVKRKDMVGIPWRVALALQADGWYLRSEIIWAKNSCMPEPVRDRCTRNHEHVFMLTKHEKYFYDNDAVKEPLVSDYSRDALSKVGDDTEVFGNNFDKAARHESGEKTPSTRAERGALLDPGGRNKRTVWVVNPSGYQGAHFAVWPPKLVEPMVKAASSERGACPHCGAPWQRITERIGKPGTKAAREDAIKANQARGIAAEGTTAAITNLSVQYGNGIRNSEGVRYETLGWEPTCKCENNDGSARSVVMDIFSGSGTTGMVALDLGRDYVGIDLNDTYLDLARHRILGLRAPKESTESDESDEGTVLDFFA